MLFVCLYPFENYSLMHTFFPILTTVALYGATLGPHSQTLWLNFKRKAARIILDKDIETPSSELFFELKWMRFPDRVIYQKAVLIYKIIND